MNSPLTILGIYGSLRKGAHSRMVLQAAQKLAPEDAKIEIFDLHPIPLFCQDEEKTPPAGVLEFKQRIRAADAILFATPEYNHSVPGVLKNAIDWASRPYGESSWNDKPVAIMSSSPGALGGVYARYQMSQLAAILNMHPLNYPAVMIAKAAEKFDANGNLIDEPSKKLIQQMLQNLVEWTRRLAK